MEISRLKLVGYLLAWFGRFSNIIVVVIVFVVITDTAASTFIELPTALYCSLVHHRGQTTFFNLNLLPYKQRDQPGKIELATNDICSLPVSCTIIVLL